MKQPGVMQMVDTLALGGLERVAVNIANLLPRERYSSHLCTTRAEGPLAGVIGSDVGRLRLERTRRFDLKALLKLSRYCRENQIQIIHAHGTALFVAFCASTLPPYPKVVWHDHYGAFAIQNRPSLAYWLLTRRVAAVLAVNESLAVWARETLRIPAGRVHYVQNFVCPEPAASSPLDLPGVKGKRIVCVANLRPQKDHLTLIRAMAAVVHSEPDATLLLLGATSDSQQLQLIQNEIASTGLHGNVHIMGSRQDVSDILAGCDIGVLSSVSEGLPLSLIEYGVAGLAAIATDVGQCAEVLGFGKAGLVIPPDDSQLLAKELVCLLQNPEKRTKLAGLFKEHVMAKYSAAATMNTVCKIYEMVLP